MFGKHQITPISKEASEYIEASEASGAKTGGSIYLLYKFFLSQQSPEIYLKQRSFYAGLVLAMCAGATWKGLDAYRDVKMVGVFGPKFANIPPQAPQVAADNEKKSNTI
jgi:hypothetical protein